jgi:threonine dehydrogenase-like Zn-dependent dehydrogenase
MVGVVKDQITFSDPDFHRKELTLLASRNATPEDFDFVISSIRAGYIPVERLITHRTSLSDAVGKLPLWATQKTGLIKAVIELG